MESEEALKKSLYTGIPLNTWLCGPPLVLLGLYESLTAACGLDRSKMLRNLLLPFGLWTFIIQKKSLC